MMWKVYLNLTSPASYSLDFEINDVKVVVTERSADITVENIQATNQQEARTIALGAANSCLDHLCWKYDTSFNVDLGKLRIEEADSEGKTVRITGFESIGLDCILVDNRPRNLGSIKGKKSDAAAYYREGCLSTKPFDKFRNFYAVIENISSKIYKKRPNEPEKAELEHALKKCFRGRLKSLREQAKVEPTLNAKKGTIPEVIRILYTANRCQLAHSKEYKDKKVPFDPGDEKEVKTALPLVKFVAKSLLEYEECSL
jgi:hypothetical protein